MGCDIHIVVERKWEGRWVGLRTDQGVTDGGYDGRSADWVRAAVGQRNYAFFARLAGVRGPGPEPLGIPGDASDLSLMLLSDWEGDGHSFSYLPLKEFAERWCAGDEVFVATMAAERLRGGEPCLRKATFPGVHRDVRSLRWHGRGRFPRRVLV